MNNNDTQVGFYYKLDVGDSPNTAAAVFQEVAGISVTMDTEEIKEGRQNGFSNKVLGRSSYENLSLKRGFVSKNSELFNWWQDVLNGSSEIIETKNIFVSLIDGTSTIGLPIMTWKFANAYPIKLEVATSPTSENKLLIESLEFAYSYFDRKDLP